MLRARGLSLVALSALALVACGGASTCPTALPQPAPAPPEAKRSPAPASARPLVLETTPSEQEIGESGWSLSGGASESYAVHRDTEGGHAAWLLEPVRDTFGEYATWMRHFDPGGLRGKRVRISATVRSQGATRRADFWARAQGKDSPSDGPGLGSDWQRISDAADWARREIVIDVPADTAWLEYGVGVAGAGKVWIENAKVEVVGPDVPLTRREVMRAPRPAPSGGIEGWTLSGLDASEYAVGRDESVKHAGKASGALWSTVPSPHGFATLEQMLSPRPYLGKRLRLRAFVKTDDVKGWAGLWMRVDLAPMPGAPRTRAAFDNMEDRPIRASTDWTRYDVVLDVAPDAAGIAFGVQLHGAGHVWLDDVGFDVVDTRVPTTGRQGRGENLDFER